MIRRLQHDDLARTSSRVQLSAVGIGGVGMRGIHEARA